MRSGPGSVGKAIATTPQFFGSNPAEVRIDHPKKGTRVLHAEEDMGRALVMALTDAQRATAVVSPTAPNDVFIVEDEAGLASGDGLVVSGAEPVRRVFLDASVDAIPDGVTIAAARLVVTIDEARVPGDTLTVVARQVLSDFVGEKTMLSPVTPATVLGAAVVPPGAASGDTLSFESPSLTRLVRQWIRDPESRRGIALTMFDERSVFGGVRLFGPEAPAGLRPRIDLLYIPPSDPGLGEGSP